MVTTGNVIGGPTVAHRNIISGNQEGIDFAFSGASSNSILNNYVGTDLNGTLARPNTSLGVFVVSDGNTIGGPGAGNLISGNTGDGLSVIGSSNLIQANYIGTNALGTTPVANAIGISIVSGASNNVIGGTVASARNVVSGNTGDGVFISGNGSTGNTVIGNYIGIDASGTAPIVNNVGVDIRFGATGNHVGGSTAGERNVISGNVIGLSIVDNGTTANRVSGNYIGTDWTGTSSVGNLSFGVLLYAGASANITGTNGDGTSDDFERNVISGNANANIDVGGGSGTIIAGNYIGTNANGSAVFGGQSLGVAISGGATNTTIGGTAVAARNIISGHTQSGVQFSGNGTTSNTVAGNYIGTDKTGTTALGNYIGVDVNGNTKLANGGYGVILNTSGVTSNTIGGSTDAARNVFASGGSSGGSSGIAIQGFGADGNVIRGNYFGTNTAGTNTLGSFQSSIYVSASAANNTIDRNVIAKGSTAGVFIDGGNSASRRDIPDFAAAWFKAEGDFDNGTGYQQPGLAVGTVSFGTVSFGTVSFGTVSFGTVSFGTVSFGTGVAGQAFQFSRATPGYVKSEHLASYTLDANNVSVESWINPATLPTAGQEYYIGSNGDASNPNFAAHLRRQDRRVSRLQPPVDACRGQPHLHYRRCR